MSKERRKVAGNARYYLLARVGLDLQSGGSSSDTDDFVDGFAEHYAGDLKSAADAADRSFASESNVELPEGGEGRVFRVFRIRPKLRGIIAAVEYLLLSDASFRVSLNRAARWFRSRVTKDPGAVESGLAFCDDEALLAFSYPCARIAARVANDELLSQLIVTVFGTCAAGPENLGFSKFGFGRDEVLMSRMAFRLIEADANFSKRLTWAARWHCYSLPNVVVSGKQAASLALSGIPSDMGEEEPKGPWPAFSISIPDGVLVHANGASVVRVLLIERNSLVEGCPSWRKSWGAQVVVRHPDDLEKGMFLSRGGENGKPINSLLTELDADDGDEGAGLSVADDVGAELLEELLGRRRRGYVDTDDDDERLLQAALRVAVGAVIRLGDASGGGCRLVARREMKTPLHVVSVGAPQDYALMDDVSVDLTEHARALTSGQRDVAWKVRWVVRGHHRNQRCGAGRGELRRVWVRPYWKGPGDAPSAVRAHILDAPLLSEDAVQEPGAAEGVPREG